MRLREPVLVQWTPTGDWPTNIPRINNRLTGADTVQTCRTLLSIRTLWPPAVHLRTLLSLVHRASLRTLLSLVHRGPPTAVPPYRLRGPPTAVPPYRLRGPPWLLPFVKTLWSTVAVALRTLLGPVRCCTILIIPASYGLNCRITTGCTHRLHTCRTLLDTSVHWSLLIIPARLVSTVASLAA